MILIRLYILTTIGKPSNPLIPEYLIAEPINLYSALIIVVGILIPFLIIYLTQKHESNNV